MADKKRPQNEEATTRQEREEIGRRANEGFAKVERTDYEPGGEPIPSGPIVKRLSEEEIRRRVGNGNFDSAKNDGQAPSINS